MKKQNITHLLKALLMIITSILTACSVKHESVNITPQLNTLNYDIGKSKKVNIIVTDNRNTENLGSSISNIGQQSKLKTDKKLIQNIKNSVTKSMESYGFIPVKKNADRKLIIKVINLSYEQHSEYLVKGNIQINCKIEAIAINHKIKLTKIFRTKYKSKITFNPDSQTNNKNINKIISINLQKILSDKEILDTLTINTKELGGYS